MIDDEQLYVIDDGSISTDELRSQIDTAISQTLLSLGSTHITNNQ